MDGKRLVATTTRKNIEQTEETDEKLRDRDT